MHPGVETCCALTGASNKPGRLQVGRHDTMQARKRVKLSLSLLVHVLWACLVPCALPSVQEVGRLASVTKAFDGRVRGCGEPWLSCGGRLTLRGGGNYLSFDYERAWLAATSFFTCGAPLAADAADETTGGWFGDSRELQDPGEGLCIDVLVEESESDECDAAGTRRARSTGPGCGATATPTVRNRTGGCDDYRPEHRSQYVLDDFYNAPGGRSGGSIGGMEVGDGHGSESAGDGRFSRGEKRKPSPAHSHQSAFLQDVKHTRFVVDLSGLGMRGKSKTGQSRAVLRGQESGPSTEQCVLPDVNTHGVAGQDATFGSQEAAPHGPLLAGPVRNEGKGRVVEGVVEVVPQQKEKERNGLRDGEMRCKAEAERPRERGAGTNRQVGAGGQGDDEKEDRGEERREMGHNKDFVKRRRDRASRATIEQVRVRA